MKKQRWLVLLGALAALAAGPALAQERGLYLGGSVGEAESNDTCEGFSPIVGCNDSDTAWRVFAGYQFNRNVALEIGWADLGAATSEGLFAGSPTTFRGEASGFDVTGLLSFPIFERLHIFTKLGIYTIRSRVDLNVAGVPSQNSHTNSGFVYGLGLGFDLWKLGVRLEWLRYDSAVRSAFAEDDVSFLSAGALLRF